MINKVEMMGDIERVLFSAEQIQERVKEVGAQISKDYYGKNPVVVGILKGVVPFYAAMTQAITIPMNGRAESLNASMAAGIILWEMTRSR